MSGSETKRQLAPGDSWLTLDEASQLIFLEGIIQGLNQGLRSCAGDISFELATRLPGNMNSEHKLAVGSLLQQTRTWAKPSVTMFRFSRALDEYARELSRFYSNYPKYRKLAPAYLMSYMDDKHGMGHAELFNLHEYSLHGFKM